MPLAPTVRTRADDPAVALVDRLPGRDTTTWVHGGDGFAGWGEAARLDIGTGPARFAVGAAQLAEHFSQLVVDDAIRAPGSGPVAFASITFDADSPGSVLVVPAVVWARREGRAWRTVVGDAAPPRPRSEQAGDDKIRYAGSSIPDLQWLDAVATATRRIDAGSLDKVVLARDQTVWSRTPFDPGRLVRRLAATFPDCYTFSVDGLVGATPELLVRRTGPRVDSLVLAGTARRDRDPVADARLGEDLLVSRKERSEHRFAVASVADTLTPRCAQLTVGAEPTILRLANVQHLATRIRGTLAGPAWPTAFELAGALHPTAAVCGTPTDDALAVIRELEGMDRGRYAGPVGWVDAAGNGEFGIALRCAQLEGARARLFAGAGLVADSLPEEELEETRLKLRAMQSAFAGP
ncbi:MAG: isochorismate synthase [Egibacteraceae bacterium]